MSKCVKCGHEILTGDIHWGMGLCNNCYNELYKDHKTHICLDKMWLKLAQDFRDENEKLQDTVADLEAKLAEKEKYTYSGKEVGEIEQYYENLLAEKEKEIRKKVCDDVIKFMEEDGFDCSDWLDLFNLISGSN